MSIDINNTQLNKISVDSADIMKMAGAADVMKKLASNIGDIGIATDFSRNTLENPLQNSFPLLTWLMNTSMSTMMRNANRRGQAQMHRDPDTGEWMLVAPYSVGTLPPEATTGLCCWIPLDITKCGGQVPLRLLCLKDCDSIMNDLVNQTRIAGSNDLTGYFLRPGETIQAARRRMARLSMAFYTANTVILGVPDAETALLKPFYGLLSVMENAAVIKILGSSILGAFDSLMCRLQVLGGSNYAFAMHPLVYMAVDKEVQPGTFGTLPAGWTRNGSELRFNGIRLIQDKMVPVDMTAGTGEIWLVDGDTTGVYLATDLAPTDSFIRSGFTSTDNPADGCATDCTFYYNFGGVFNTNPNRLAVITDVPLSANCMGAAMQGLDSLIQPDTLVPMSRG